MVMPPIPPRRGDATLPALYLARVFSQGRADHAALLGLPVGGDPGLTRPITLGQSPGPAAAM